ncbi:MAG: hypothetical protein JJV98_09755 [Desulfosarcina sp.]|nr:hypothetical protein [Desulfobacterales bacterium]
MTPYELAASLYREISPVAPRLAAALNRALLEIGEGSVLVGLSPGLQAGDDVTFSERETLKIDKDGAAGLLARITQALQLLEGHSSWQVLIDKKGETAPGQLELMYTLFRPQAP